MKIGYKEHIDVSYSVDQIFTAAVLYTPMESTYSTDFKIQQIYGLTVSQIFQIHLHIILP